MHDIDFEHLVGFFKEFFSNSDFMIQIWYKAPFSYDRESRPCKIVQNVGPIGRAKGSSTCRFHIFNGGINVPPSNIPSILNNI